MAAEPLPTARLLRLADPSTVSSLFGQLLGARGAAVAIGGDSMAMYLASIIAGVAARYKDTPLWRLKRQVLKQDLPWLGASRENSWNALLDHPVPHVLNWTRWGLAAGSAPSVVVIGVGGWCLHMHPFWTWREEWKLKSKGSHAILLDPTCCGRSRYRTRLELVVDAVRQHTPRALIVLKTPNALCEEQWVESAKKQSMPMGQGLLHIRAYDAFEEGRNAALRRPPKGKAAALLAAADDAQAKVGLSRDEYVDFYRRQGAHAQREVIRDVAAAHAGVVVLDAFATTAQLGCQYTNDGVHYTQRARALLALELLDLCLRSLFNESLRQHLPPEPPGASARALPASILGISYDRLRHGVPHGRKPQADDTRALPRSNVAHRHRTVRIVA